MKRAVSPQVSHDRERAYGTARRVHAPPHPRKDAPRSGSAETSIVVPSGTKRSQSGGHTTAPEIPATVAETVPLPSTVAVTIPAVATDGASRAIPRATRAMTDPRHGAAKRALGSRNHKTPHHRMRREAIWAVASRSSVFGLDGCTAPACPNAQSHEGRSAAWRRCSRPAGMHSAQARTTRAMRGPSPVFRCPQVSSCRGTRRDGARMLPASEGLYRAIVEAEAYAARRPRAARPRRGCHRQALAARVAHRPGQPRRPGGRGRRAGDGGRCQGQRTRAGAGARVAVMQRRYLGCSA